MIVYSLFIFLFFTLFNVNLFASNVGDAIKKINVTTINTLLIFTSQKGLNSGSYTFTNTPSDVDMKIYHLPFSYTFKSDSNLHYFVVGNVGYSRVGLSETGKAYEEGLIINSNNDIQTYTMGLGGGISYDIYKNLKIAGGLEFIYSRAGVSISNTRGDIADIIDDLFDDNYSENLTYKFFTALKYEQEIAGYKPYSSLEFSLYDTKSTFSLDDVASFESQSKVLSLNIGCESPKLYSYSNENYLTLKAYIEGHLLSGVVKDIAKVSKYGSFGGVIYWYTDDAPWWASRFFVELNRVKGDGIHGYNIGAGFTVDF